LVSPKAAARKSIRACTSGNPQIRPTISWSNNEQAPICIALARRQWHPTQRHCWASQ